MDPKIAEFKVAGICAATFTAFNDDGSLKLDAIPAQVEELVRGGVISVFVNGTTGESYSLTSAERKTLAEAWVKACAGSLSVIVHVGCESVADSKDLAAHAAEVGAQAIALMPPVFFKPPTMDSLAAILTEVAAAAPALPLYYYHIPAMTGVTFPMDKFLESVHGRIPTLRGLKFSHSDLHMYSNCVAFADGAYDCLFGSDEQMLGALSMGGRGVVGSTYNYMAATYTRLIKAFEAGDMETALKEQRRSQLGVDLLKNGKYGDAVNVGKAMLEIKGVAVGPPRLPRMPMSPANFAKLRSDMEAIGFFEWSN